MYRKIILCFVLILFFPCCNSKPIPPIKPPDNIAELKLKEYKTGKEALKEIFRLHGRRMGLVNGYVANYIGKEEKATIYYSIAKDERIAKRLLTWMVKRIGESHEVFQGLKKQQLKSQVFYSVYGQGQKHFFFRKNDRIIWIAADPRVANSAIEDFVKK